MRKVVTFLGVLFVLTAMVACGDNDVGETCEEEGRVDGECVEGSVCGKSASGSLVCQKQCSSVTDCSAEETCNAVGSSSLKGCRAK